MVHIVIHDSCGDYQGVVIRMLDVLSIYISEHCWQGHIVSKLIQFSSNLSILFRLFKVFSLLHMPFVRLMQKSKLTQSPHYGLDLLNGLRFGSYM